MVRNDVKRDKSAGKLIAAGDRFGASKSSLEDDIEALFQLPLPDFTAARNELAARLKKEGRANEAGAVKVLAKPSISAWVVNQIYWHHRDEFDELLAAGQRVRKFQTSGFAGKVPEMRAALDTRTRTLTRLADLASELLRNAGSNPTPDTVRRVTTTLEALSSFASLDDGPTLGRLIQDVDPPGFESLTSFSFGASSQRIAEPVRQAPAKKADPPKSSKQVNDEQKQRKLEETRQAMMAAAKVSLQSAKKLLAASQAEVKSLEVAEKKANGEAKEAEKRRREAEAQLKKLTSAADAASERAEAIAEEVEEASKAVDAAKRNVEKVSRELEVLLGM